MGLGEIKRGDEIEQQSIDLIQYKLASCVGDNLALPLEKIQDLAVIEVASVIRDHEDRFHAGSQLNEEQIEAHIRTRVSQIFEKAHAPKEEPEDRGSLRQRLTDFSESYDL